MQVLVALQRLVNALGTDAPAAYPLLLPILQLCTDINQVTTWRHSKAVVDRGLLFRPAPRQPLGLQGPCCLAQCSQLLSAFSITAHWIRCPCACLLHVACCCTAHAWAEGGKICVPLPGAFP